MGWSLESKGTDLISCKWNIGGAHKKTVFGIFPTNIYFRSYINLSFTNIFGHSTLKTLYEYIWTFVGECARV